MIRFFTPERSIGVICVFAGVCWLVVLFAPAHEGKADVLGTMSTVFLITLGWNIGYYSGRGDA